MLLTKYIITLPFIFFLLIYIYFKWSFNYWQRKKFDHLNPSIPNGNWQDPAKTNIHSSIAFANIYKKMRSRNWNHGGVYVLTLPKYIPVHPEYVKKIMVDDYNYFLDRGVYYNERDDPLSAHLFALGGAKWKNLRKKLNPTFTSAKVKMMFPILAKCLIPMHESIEKSIQLGKPIDIKEVSGCFTTNVIGCAAFGLELETFEDQNSPFRSYGKRAFNHGPKRFMQRRLKMAFPNLSRFLGLISVPRDVSQFFMDMVKETVDLREKNQELRKDFFQMLMEMKKNDELTMEQVAAQAFLFFTAGFETSSATMAFTLYELAKNEDIQNRVRGEIWAVLAKNGEFSYETVQELKYLSRVVDEVLRMYPPVSIIRRKCVQDYKHPLEDGLVIEKGTNVVIPVYGIHHDPEYYPEPEKFDPERFTEENKAKLPPCSYLPFGQGHRQCLGMRFGLMQTKLGLASMINRYKFTVSKKTIEPIEFDVGSIVLTIKGDLWLNAKILN